MMLCLKHYFEVKKQGGVIENVISIILGIDKEKLVYADYQAGELVKNKLFEKGQTCDIIIKIDDGNKIILEMNQIDTKTIFYKNTTYSFTIINESIMRRGKDYIYPSVILINFDAFNRFKTNKGILEFKIRDAEGHVETNIYRSIHLILENLVNTEYNEDVRKLAEFLSIKDIETLRKRYEVDSNYMACIRKVENSRTDPEFVGYYDIEEAHKQELADSYNTGYDKGMDIGKQEEKIEIAKIMLQKNMSIKDIADITCLSIEEIKEL